MIRLWLNSATPRDICRSMVRPCSWESMMASNRLVWSANSEGGEERQISERTLRACRYLLERSRVRRPLASIKVCFTSATPWSQASGVRNRPYSARMKVNAVPAVRSSSNSCRWLSHSGALRFTPLRSGASRARRAARMSASRWAWPRGPGSPMALASSPAASSKLWSACLLASGPELEAGSPDR